MGQVLSPDVDLQVTVTEVRPDGKETYVQSGWLRASERKLEGRQQPLAPEPTFGRADARPLPKGKFTELTVPLYYEGHVYRAGSRIRIIIARPTATSRSGRSPTRCRRAPRPCRSLTRADALEGDPAGRAGRARPDRAAAVPGAARRAVPDVRSDATK